MHAYTGMLKLSQRTSSCNLSAAAEECSNVIVGGWYILIITKLLCPTECAITISLSGPKVWATLVMDCVNSLLNAFPSKS